jgi:magnesium-transporting ATPase (P-type)
MTDEHSNQPKNRNRRVIFRYLFYASAVLCAIGWLSLFVFTQRFISAPTTLDRNSANIVVWNNHGTYHYITLQEDRIKNMLITFNVLMFVCAASFGYIDQNRN